VPLRLPLRLRLREGTLNVAELDWIDSFYGKVKDHVFLREEDDVLILPPSRVYKVNEGGKLCLRHLSSRRHIRTLPGLRDGERAFQVHTFFCDLEALYRGCSTSDRLSLQTVGYDFSYTRLPVLAEIAVTYRCNNACSFCYAGCGRSRRPEEAREMTLAEVRRVIRVFKEEAQVPFFSFTGGEPLLRPELEKMIRYARGLDLQVNLITNATLVDERRARSLAASGLETAQVSVESRSAELHDELCRSPGAHERTLRGIRLLQQAGIDVQTNTTLNALNAAEAGALPGFLAALGVGRFAMNLYVPGSAEQAREELFLPYSSAPELVEAAREAASRLGLDFTWYSPLPHCHYNPVARGLGNKSCAAMDGLLSVSPSGDVLPCSSYAEPMGNLLAQPFREIWFSERARFFKQKRYAPEECAGCDHFVACQAACPLYWRVAGTAEIRNPCRAAAASRGEKGCAT
jgi:radical SAM protein with 4Fe4S-binding SPASM domain